MLDCLFPAYCVRKAQTRHVDVCAILGEAGIVITRYRESCPTAGESTTL